MEKAPVDPINEISGWTDFWQVLQVEENSSIDEVNKSYRRLARLFHPDTRSKDKRVDPELFARKETLPIYIFTYTKTNDPLISGQPCVFYSHGQLGTRQIYRIIESWPRRGNA